jgi:hypothetical protein
LQLWQELSQTYFSKKFGENGEIEMGSGEGSTGYIRYRGRVECVETTSTKAGKENLKKGEGFVEWRSKSQRGKLSP